jgi:hypothetical protein
MKIMAQKIAKNYRLDSEGFKDIMTNTTRIARLKLFFSAAKVVKDSNRDKVKFSIHDARTPPMMKFLKLLDAARSKPWPWVTNGSWLQFSALRLS